MSYSYDRTASKLPSLSQLLDAHLEQLAKLIASQLPKRLTEDGVKVVSSGRNYAEVSFKGYTASDLAVTGSVSLTVFSQPTEIRAYLFARSADMAQVKHDLRLALDEDPAQLLKNIMNWLASY